MSDPLITCVECSTVEPVESALDAEEGGWTDVEENVESSPEETPLSGVCEDCRIESQPDREPAQASASA